MKFWNKDFSMIATGQTISLFANNILHFALSLYVLDLTNSGTAFGVITAISMIPTILFMPFGGILADRINRRNLMLTMDMLTSVVLLIFSFIINNFNPIIAVVLLMVLLSLIEALYTPCVQASIPVLQEKQNVAGANALVNQIAMSSNITGPILGGILYGFLGLRTILYFCTLSFVLSGITKMFVNIPFHKKPDTSHKKLTLIKADLRESIEFLRIKQKEILGVIPAIAALNFTLSPIITVGAPYMIRVILGLSSELYGVATGSIAAAGLLGGLIAALFARKIHTKFLYIFLILTGLFLTPLGFGFLWGGSEFTLYILMIGCFMAVQICASIFSIFTTSAIQIRTPNHLLGKIMAFVSTLNICVEPVGRAVYGVLFDLLSESVYIIMFLTAVMTVSIALTTKRPFERMSKTA
ncbi:MAG: MFS transporter [Bacillota bacterium]|jgi:MFS family permease